MIYFPLHCNYHLVVESQLIWAFLSPMCVCSTSVDLRNYNCNDSRKRRSKIQKKKKKKNNKLAWHGIQPLATPHHFSRRCIGGVVLRLQCASASLLFCMLTWRTKRGRRGHVTHTTRGRVEEAGAARRIVDNTQAYFSFFR